MKNQSKLLTLISACLLVVPGWVGSFVAGGPTLRCPLPLLITLPSFALVEALTPKWVQATVLLPAGLFLAWNFRLLGGATKIPRRSIVLLGVCTALTVLYFTAVWRDGVRYQGIHYTQAICGMNCLWLVLLWLLLIRDCRHSSFIGNLLFHWTLFAWLSWYAFPWLGELP